MKQSLRMVAVSVCALTLVACSTVKELGSIFDGKHAKNDAASVQSIGLDENGLLQGTAIEGLSPSGPVDSRQVVYYNYDQYDILPDYQPVIQMKADYLLKHPQTTVRIEGYTDEMGSREYNIALGERRANSVKQALELQGVLPEQMTVVSYGMEYPVIACAHKQRCQLNRRSVIVFTHRA